MLNSHVLDYMAITEIHKKKYCRKKIPKLQDCFHGHMQDLNSDYSIPPLIEHFKDPHKIRKTASLRWV